MIKILIGLIVLGFATTVWGSGVGMSTLPMAVTKKFVTAEFTGVVSDDGGTGLQARYTQKMTDRLTFDAGIGMSGGERSNDRMFAGLDLEMYPDHMRQPRISMKGSFESSQDYGVRRTMLNLSPVVSKGFSFWGHEAFPFGSLPIGLGLEGESKTYTTTAQLGLGINGQVPFKQFSYLTASAELLVNLKDSYSGVAVGISYPLQ